MACRCVEIGKLITEIDKLGGALKKVNDALSNSENTIANMKKAANIFESGVIIGGHQDELAQNIMSKYDSTAKDIKEAYTAVTSALEAAKSELSDARIEDKLFHKRKNKH